MSRKANKPVITYVQLLNYAALELERRVTETRSKLDNMPAENVSLYDEAKAVIESQVAPLIEQLKGIEELYRCETGGEMGIACLDE